MRPVEMDPIFNALANEHRREIVHALSIRPRSIGELAAERGLSLPAIHKHIRVLEEAGLLLRKKVGRTNFVALGRRPLQHLQTWVEQFHPYWGDDRETLDNYTDSMTKRHDEEETA